MLQLLHYLNRQETTRCAFVFILILVQVWLELKLPDYMADITILVETPDSPLMDIVRQGAYMLLCAACAALAFLLTAYLAARVAAGLSRTLRRTVYEKTLHFSQKELQHFSTASLINRTTNDITQIQQLVSIALQILLKGPILAAWAIWKISGKEWQWSAATAVAVFFLLIVMSAILIFVVPRFRLVQKLSDTLNRIVREQLQGIRVIRAYNANKYQEQKFAAANAALTQNDLFSGRIMAILEPAIMLLCMGLTLAVYWIGANIISAAGMADRLRLFADMVVFSNYALQVIMAFMMMNMVFIMLPRAQVSVHRILEVLNLHSDMTAGTYVPACREPDTRIEFQNVTFRYHEGAAPVLQDVSFQIQKGQTLAIIGATGSGKTTLMQLLLRCFDTSEGSIRINGQDIRSYHRSALQRLIGYVPQHAMLFSGTIADNIAYGDNGQPRPDDAAIQRAAHLACCTEFIEALPDGYASPVAQGGSNFSGGQRQRLTIARAIAWNPEIFIFDDSFSALDYQTDRQLRKNLASELRDTIKIIVAQRVGTIRQADDILVLEHGRIVGHGTHKELLRTCSVYQEIAHSQLSEEELAYV